jgi:flagellar basal body-associated protein FliL
LRLSDPEQKAIIMAEEKKDSKAAPAKEGADKADAHGGKAKGGGIMGMLTKMPVMLGGVMVLEAVVLFAGFKFMGGGKPTVVVGADLVSTEKAGAAAGDGHGKEGHATPSTPADKSKFAELLLAEMKAPNKSTGRAYMFDVSIYAVTNKDHEEQVKATIKSREALIKDRVRTIIAQSDPEKLGGQAEPGLETLRRQVKHQLEEIIGEGLIDEVLVPRCNGFRTD